MRFDALVRELRLAVLVFRRNRVIYTNPAADSLAARLHEEHGIELALVLRNHLANLLESDAPERAVSLLTAATGEPFCLHVARLASRRGDPDVVVSVRELGVEREAFRQRYGLSEREGQVLELVLRGYSNRDVATTLRIAPATAKKHLTRIFDKLGVDSRAQLISRLA